MGPAAPALQGLFVGLHGSWNRRPLSGYKVVYLPWADGRPLGRPVGVALDARGALLVADDVGNTIWRVSPR